MTIMNNNGVPVSRISIKAGVTSISTNVFQNVSKSDSAAWGTTPPTSTSLLVCCPGVSVRHPPRA